MVNELSDLSGTNGNEALVAAVLPILLLEDDARHATSLALLGGYALPRCSARNREDGFGKFGVGSGQIFEVREWWEL